MIFLASENRVYTYENLHCFTAFFHDLLTQKLHSSQPVAFVSGSSDILIFSIAACWKLGIPFISLSPQTPSHRLEKQLQELGIKLIFCDPKNQLHFPKNNTILMDNDYFLTALTHDIKNFQPPKTNEINVNTTFGYFFTSGTSGKPKVVPLKRRQMLSASTSSAQNMKPDPNCFWLLCLPLNHIGGISIILRSLIYNTGIYRLNSFREETVKPLLQKNTQIQAISLVPTMLKRLLDDPYFKIHKKFKAVLLGGGPCNGSILHKAVERDIPIVSSYGMTETCGQITANPMLIPSEVYPLLKSVGKPLSPNELEIRDEDGKKMGVNASGTIWLRGSQIFDGYYNKKDNEGKFDEANWFNTGDYGYLNENEELFIESRRMDLIVTGGENVNPIEVEEVMQKIPYIKEVVVIGVPDEEWGQKVTAVIVPTNKTIPDAQKIRNELKKHLIDFKIPKEFKIVDHIPKTITGKIKRNELRKS